MAEANLTVQPREGTGKQAAKRLRREGQVPGILYGLGMSPEPLSIDRHDLLVLLHSFGRNAVVNLSVGARKDTFKTFIYDIQHDPLSGEITHVDMKQISLNEKIHVSVPINLLGTPEGVKTEGGIIEHLMHTVDISCLPTNIPSEIKVDVSELHLGDVIHVSDLQTKDYDVLSDPETAVVHIVMPRIVALAEEEGEEEALEEGMEPEVIGEESDEEGASEEE